MTEQSSNASFGEQFTKRWDQIQSGLKRPHILLSGLQKSGKSSIVECIYGSGASSIGVPITNDYLAYDSPDKSVAFYDGPGVIVGKSDVYFAGLKRFLEKHTANDDVVNEIHVVWHVINGQAPKVEGVEEVLCRKVFRDMPIIILINKADVSTPQTIQKIRNTVESWNLPNIKNIVEITTKDRSVLTANAKTSICPRCQSEDVTVKLGKKIFQCDACKLELPLSPVDSLVSKSVPASASNSPQLQSVVEMTKALLPQITRDSFVAASFHDLGGFEVRSHQAIMNLYDSVTTEHSATSVANHTTACLHELSNIWQLRRSDLNTYCRSTVEQFGRAPTSLVFWQENKGVKRRVIALSLLWLRCLRKLAVRVVKEFVGSNHNGSHIDSNYDSFVQSAFEGLSEPNLTKIEESLVFNGTRGYLLKGSERRFYEQITENEKQLLNEQFEEVK